MPEYFSEARGIRKGIELAVLRVVVGDLYQDLKERDHLTEWLGYHCVDAGQVPGTARDPGATLYLKSVALIYGLQIPSRTSGAKMPSLTFFSLLVGGFRLLFLKVGIITNLMAVAGMIKHTSLNPRAVNICGVSIKSLPATVTVGR